MTDFTPPSDSDPSGDDDPYGRASSPDWGQSPPSGIPPQPSPWGDPAQAGGWNEPGQPGYDPASPYPPGGQQWSPGWQEGYGGYRYPKSSQATTALVLSILGLICCGPLAVIGAVMGKSDVNAIARGEVDPTNQGTAQAGFVIGLIGSILWLGLILFYVVAIAFSVATGS